MIQKTYLIHPYETGGNTIEENRADEERIVQELEEMNCSFYLVRPFKRIQETMKRRKALKMGQRLLKKCGAVLLTGDWKKSAGCVAEFEQAVNEGKELFEYRDNRIFYIPKIAVEGILDDIKRQNNQKAG